MCRRCNVAPSLSTHVGGVYHLDVSPYMWTLCLDSYPLEPCVICSGMRVVYPFLPKCYVAHLWCSVVHRSQPYSMYRAFALLGSGRCYSLYVSVHGETCVVTRVNCFFKSTAKGMCASVCCRVYPLVRVGGKRFERKGH